MLLYLTGYKTTFPTPTCWTCKLLCRSVLLCLDVNNLITPCYVCVYMRVCVCVHDVNKSMLKDLQMMHDNRSFYMNRGLSMNIFLSRVIINDSTPYIIRFSQFATDVILSRYFAINRQIEYLLVTLYSA